MDLVTASNQWATRPADERFWTLREMREHCTSVRAGCSVGVRPFKALRATAENGAVQLMGGAGKPAHLTHYAFGQLATSVGAPQGYLRSLPAHIAADALNAGILARSTDASDRNILFHTNGHLTVRALLSERYDRVWDNDVVRMCEDLDGWRCPAGRTPPGYKGESRAATSDDILPGQINIQTGDSIAPSGLYASDHDMFAFLVAPDRVISDGAGGQLMRGVFVRNSEVGDAAFSVTFFLMQAVCGNHIVWNATGVHEIRVRHIGQGTLGRVARGFQAELRRYLNAAPEEERGIVAARRMVLGNSKEVVLSALGKYIKSHSIPLPKTTLSAAYDVAADHTDWYGSPNTVWGSVAGLTQLSQQSTYADDRNALDRAAGKLLAMAVPVPSESRAIVLG
jgi:hypothetical protein